MSSKYKAEYQEIRALGSGGFSTVFESIKEGKSYAVKKIPINIEEKEKAIKEIDFLRSLKSDFVVYYIDSWIENNYYLPFNSEHKLDYQSLLFKPEKTFLIHIQMELCSMTLNELIKSFDNTKKNLMNLKDYSIACDIFEHILECVHYLHQQSPSIIHRDLKPENIMLTTTVNNSYKVKLTDFGLSTYHEYVDQSHTKYIGTKRFRAPELNTREYDRKADIYSLGKIMELLFNINHNSAKNENDIEIKENFENVKLICLKCVSHIAKQRPDCQQILNDKHIWSYSRIINIPSFNIFAKKWPYLNKINKELLLRTKNISIIEELETKLIFIGNDNITYGLRLSDHIDITTQEPKIINQFSKKEIQNIVGGIYHVICLTKDSSVYSLGVNEIEHLAYQTIFRNNKPTIIDELKDKDIIEISCGFFNTIALSKSGNAYVWGNVLNRNVDAVNGLTNNYQFPVDIFTTNYIFRGKNSNNKLSAIVELNDKNIIEISCGAFYSIALSNSGNAFAFGCGLFGMAYDDNDQLISYELKLFNNEKIVTLSAGYNHCIALSDCGKLYGWGHNNCGQLGIGYRFINQNEPNLIIIENDSIVKKIRCGMNFSLILTSNNDIYSLGDNSNYELVNDYWCFEKRKKIETIIKFIDIETKFYHTFSVALSTDNEYYVWGNCNQEIIATPIKTDFTSFIETFISIECASLFYHSISDKKNLVNIFNEINSYKQINDKIMANISRFKLVRINESKALLQTNDDIIYTFRLNESIDNSTEEPIIVNEISNKRIKSIISGYNHVLCLTESNEVYSFGNNFLEQLGNGSEFDNFKPSIISELSDKKIVEISCGAFHSLALSEFGDLFVWGSGCFGQIGNGENNNEIIPTEIISIKSMKIVSISCGLFHCLALSESGILYGWGNNDFGQLGVQNDLTHYHNEPLIISTKNIKIKKISCGLNHSLILSEDNFIHSFGLNNCGQLGIGNTINQFEINKIKTSIKFTDIYTTWCDNISAGLSQTGIYYVWGKCGDEMITSPKESEFNSFDEIFVKYSISSFTTKQIKFQINVK